MVKETYKSQVHDVKNKPPFWQLMPKACSLDAQGLFTRCPRLVRPMPVRCSVSSPRYKGRLSAKDMFGVNDKKMKLEQAKLQLHELQKNTSHIEARNRDIKADLEKTAISYQQQIINKIWAQADMKALAEIADIYPRMTSIHDSSLFDDSFAMDFINHGDKIIYCAMYLPGKKFFPAGLLVCL